MRKLSDPLTTTTEQKCKSKTVISVNSTTYNEDLNYQNSIDEKLRAYQLKNK